MKKILILILVFVNFLSYGQTAQGWVNIGTSINYLDHHSNAEVDYTDVKELNGLFDVYSKRDYDKYQLDGYKKAISNFNKAISLNPKYSLAYYFRGVVKHKLKDYSGAIADYTKSIAIDPKCIYYNDRGISKYQLKDYEGAIADFTKSIELNPSYSCAYFNRGVIKIILNNKNGACEDWKNAGNGNQNLRYGYCNW
jgi:tetratricopeptide (TPR) repeat protein